MVDIAKFEQDVMHPKTLLTHAGIQPGMTVADFGVGRAAIFTMEAARLVGNGGIVYGVDVVKEVLDVVESKMEHAGIQNVISVWSDLELYGATKKIPDTTVDLGLLIDTLCQSQQRAAIVKECVRMVKSGGHLLVVDWKPEETAIGPPLDHRMHSEDMKKIAADIGLTLIDEFAPSEYHWGLLYKR